MKKILVLSGVAEVSGAEFCMLNILKHLDKKEYQVILGGIGGGRLQALAEEQSIPFVDFRASNRSIRGPFATTLNVGKAFVNAVMITKFIRHAGVQLVYSNSYRIGVVGGLAARFAQVPSVWHVRDVPTTPVRMKAVRFSARALADFTIFASKAVYRLNGFTEDEASRAGVVYDGVETQRYAIKGDSSAIEQEFGLEKDTPLLTNIGLLISNKGQEYFIRAVSKVARVFPEVKAMIVGEYNPSICLPAERTYESKLKALVDELKLGENIIFTGFRSDVPDILKRTDIYVHTGTYPDPFPGVILEALASSVPVVAFNVGGVSESVIDHQTGYLVAPADVDALAERIIFLLRNQPTRIQMGQRGRKTIETNLDTRDCVAKIQKVFEKLTGC